MQLVRKIYIILILISVKSGSFNSDVNAFDQTELEYLSFRLNPLECLQLVDKMTVSIEYEKLTTQILRRSLDSDRTTRQDCLVKLENWNNNFLGRKNDSIREAMDVTLRMLGRPDLAKYIERKRKLDISKGQRHSLSKRSLYGNVELSKVVLSKENEKNIKGKENCTNQIHEAHHNASPAEAKVLPQTKQPQEVGKEEDQNNKNQVSKTMQWINILILFSLSLIVTCILLLCITRVRKRRKMLSAGSNNGYNCTCTCSDVDIESGSVNDYPEYHRGRKNDREKSRKPLKKKKKEKTKDGDLLESFIKKSSKAKEQRKKHKYKTKSVRTKDFDRTKSDKKKIRSNLIADFKKYPTCDCCKCTADYK